MTWTKEKLMPFASPDELRFWCREPFTFNSMTYATDCVALVYVRQALRWCSPVIQSAVVPTIERYTRETESVSEGQFVTLPDLPPVTYLPWKTGYRDDDGYREAAIEYGTYCASAKLEPVQIGGVQVALDRLTLAKNCLPNLRVWPDAARQALVLLFDDGRGLLKAVRPGMSEPVLRVEVQS